MGRFFQGGTNFFVRAPGGFETAQKMFALERPMLRWAGLGGVLIQQAQ